MSVEALPPALNETWLTVVRLGGTRVTARDVADELGVTVGTAGGRLKALRSRGLLRVTGRQRGRQARPDNEYTVPPRLRDDYQPDRPREKRKPPEVDVDVPVRRERRFTKRATPDVHKLVSGKEERTILREALELGATVVRLTDHTVMVELNGERIGLPRTPSDWRAYRNVRAAIRRAVTA